MELLVGIIITAMLFGLLYKLLELCAAVTQMRESLNHFTKFYYEYATYRMNRDKQQDKLRGALAQGFGGSNPNTGDQGGNTESNTKP